MSRLPSYTVLDWKLERLPAGELRALQGARLAAMARYVYECTPFWRRKFDAVGLLPQHITSIDELGLIPFCDRRELQQDQAAFPPFGSYVATDRSRWRHFAATSGTTGVPLRRVFSQRDWSYVLDRFQRNPTLGPGDIVMILGPTDGLIGPTLAAATAQRLGALVVHAGRYDSRTKIGMILDLKPTVVTGTASYLLHLLDVAAAMRVDLREAGIRAIASVGEPGAAVAASRERLAQGWGAQVRDGFGLTEIFPLGGSCAHSTALHIASDMALVEAIDPQTGRQLAAGEAGELVVSNLVGDTQPLLRYRTRDVVRFAVEPACRCGFTGTRLEGGILGRIDDMIWIRGANVFPLAIENAVRQFKELSSEYQIVVEGDSLPRLTVRAEPLAADLAGSSELESRLCAAVKAAVGINARVELVAFGTLPRGHDKAKPRRVLDLRTKANP
jgi:phenylacetate-CoA ligase